MQCPQTIRKMPRNPRMTHVDFCNMHCGNIQLNAQTEPVKLVAEGRTCRHYSARVVVPEMILCAMRIRGHFYSGRRLGSHAVRNALVMIPDVYSPAESG